MKKKQSSVIEGLKRAAKRIKRKQWEKENRFSVTKAGFDITQFLGGPTR